MRDAAQRKYPIRQPAAESFGPVASSSPRAFGSANEPRFVPGDDGGPGQLRANRSGDYPLRHAAALDSSARSHRTAGLVAVHRAMFDAVADGLRLAIARLWHRQRARVTIEALAALDAHALRDIGLDRSEVQSVAGEIEEPATATRMHAVAHRRGR